jgi:hypothetical protein
MNRQEQLEQLYQRLACLEDLHDEIENLAGIRIHLAERVNSFLDRLNNCRQERQRLIHELEHFNDVDNNSSEFADIDLPALIGDLTGFEQGISLLGRNLRTMNFEATSLEDSIGEVEVEIESVSHQTSIRTNPVRGH